MKDQDLSRRSFIRSGAILGGGLLISFSVYPKSRGGDLKISEVAETFVPNAFLRINADNSINVLLAHSEMGQGIWTSLPMIIADELDADWHDINVEHAPAATPYKHTIFGMQITGGSSTTYSEFDRYRTAGATARMLLLEAGAKKFGTDVSNCSTNKGFVVYGNNKIAYGELVIEAAKLTPPATIILKEPKDWNYIGISTKRLDGVAKVNGTAVFGMDVKGEGLLIAVVTHSPVIGAKLLSWQ